MHATRRLILSASVRFSNDRNLINQAVKILSYLVCIGFISIIYFTLCKIKKKFVSKTYIKVLVTFDAEVMVAPLAAADVNPSIESWKLHLSLLQKHSSTLGAALWLLPLLTRTDSNSTRQPSANGKKEGAHPRNMPTKNGEKTDELLVCAFSEAEHVW